MKIAWITWALMGICLELFALFHHSPGLTLSEHVWALRGTGFFSLIIFFLLWVVYHFIREGKIHG